MIIFLTKLRKLQWMESVIINTNVPLTHSLTLDYKEQTLYWIDSDYRVLESSTVNGTNRRTIYLFSQSYVFYGISVFNNTLYLSQQGNTIYRVSASEHNHTKTRISIPHLCYNSYRQLKIFSQERQPMAQTESGILSNSSKNT